MKKTAGDKAFNKNYKLKSLDKNEPYSHTEISEAVHEEFIHTWPLPSDEAVICQHDSNGVWHYRISDSNLMNPISDCGLELVMDSGLPHLKIFKSKPPVITLRAIVDSANVIRVLSSSISHPVPEWALKEEWQRERSQIPRVSSIEWGLVSTPSPKICDLNDALNSQSKQTRPKVQAAKFNFETPEVAERVVMSAARRVIDQHRTEIEALVYK